ncbi:MAG: energy transducer TonB, partial [Alphaproteobacteria bacterium]|nr:energy transducer TonB [Alphaproteobacteria bacterium]
MKFARSLTLAAAFVVSTGRAEEAKPAAAPAPTAAPKPAAAAPAQAAAPAP